MIYLPYSKEKRSQSLKSVQALREEKNRGFVSCIDKEIK